MSWDKLAYKIYKDMKLEPIFILLIIWILVHVPIRHCENINSDLCKEIILNLFVIEFPYLNLVQAFDQFFWPTAILYLASKTILYFKARRIIKNLNELKSEVNKQISTTEIKLKEYNKKLDILEDRIVRAEKESNN